MAALTCSRPTPTTTPVAWGLSAAIVRKTCSKSGLPDRGCSTLGKADFIREPTPAARTKMDSELIAPSPSPARPDNPSDSAADRYFHEFQNARQVPSIRQ